MAKRNEPARMVEVESYCPCETSGLHGPVHIRPCGGQGISKNLHVECSKALVRNYPVGSKFMIRAKLTDRAGGGEYVYRHHGWQFEVVSVGEGKRWIS